MFSASGIATFYGDINTAIGASSRVFALMDRSPKIAPSGTHKPTDFKGDIQFSGVSFRYPSREDSLVLSDISVQVPAGTVLAVVGPSGSG